MLEKFKNHIDKKFQHLKEETFLLACSGGLDSVVLAHLCHTLHLNFSLAHCNFKLRGEASDLDELFVRDMAKSLKKVYFSKSFNTLGYMQKHKISLQVAARELRYAWFSSILKENSISTLVTAHQADDHLETFLINLSRGTGIDGLTGIPEKTNSISRPLLPFSREEIMAYAQENGLQWREDESNKETKYVRNKIRHTIVPSLKEIQVNFLDNFLKTQEYLGQTAEILEGHLARVRKELFQQNQAIFYINIASLRALDPNIGYIYQLFKPYGFLDATAIISLFDSLTGKELRSRTHRLLKDRERLVLQEISPLNTGTFYLEQKDTVLLFPVHLSSAKVKAIENTSIRHLYVDALTLKFPLEVRKAKKGDYFYPFGMNGRKKLSKFFKDEKYSQIDKEQQWLLCSQNSIVWVIGKRADDRFKVTDKTTNILKFSLLE